MKTYAFYEPDQWTTDGAKITSPENLEIIRQTLEDDGPIIVEHWLYRRGSALDRFIFDTFEDFMEYLETKALAGDRIEVWNFPKVCIDENRLWEMPQRSRASAEKGRVLTLASHLHTFSDYRGGY